MDKKYKKTTDNKLEIEEPVVRTINLKDLKIQKKVLEDSITGHQREIDKIDVLIEKCEELGIEEN